MKLHHFLRQYGGALLLAVATLGMLYMATLLYTVGETLLAATVLIIASLAAWTYTSAKTGALRYLFPGIAAAVVFVVFPMVYTVTIGFTNYSSQNLLDFERARQYLLDETYVEEDAKQYLFTLHADGSEFRVRMEDEDDETSAFVSPALALAKVRPLTVQLEPLNTAQLALNDPLALKEVIAYQAALKPITFKTPDGEEIKLASLRKFSPTKHRYQLEPDGALLETAKNQRLVPNLSSGYFETPDGTKVQPGFKVNVGLAHYKRIFTDSKFSEPFLRIFGWTVAFSGLTVLFAASLGMFLAVLLSWDSLKGRKVYQLLLFLPYAVPGFISILIFKGLFNQNLGEINMILEGLFGIKPAWFSDPFLAKAMLLIVNTWLGFPYMMIICMGLIKSIPSELYEASAVAGAGPLTNFFGITLPLILKPLTPLLISSFAFNFNNFVLITLLTGGRPDFLDIAVPAGTTDILVSYTFRIAFQDSGQQFGLASAVSTVIFLIVAGITLLQMRYSKVAQTDKR
ncbi:MAG: maltose transporter permease MalF [Pseudomonadota bacterium]|jgi:maltose/maltodextrin transport system permease protein